MLGATSVLLLPLGRLVGVQELYPVGIAGLVCLAIAILWARSLRWDLEVRRVVHPAHIAAGERPVVDLSVRNRLLRPSPVIALDDPIGHLAGRQRLLAPIGGQDQGTYRYHLPAVGRGAYQAGPLIGSVTDPLGLSVRRRELAPAERIVVHPAPTVDGKAVIAGGFGRRDGITTARAGSDNDEFSSLREYRPGDDLRRIHWASSARTDTLLVREDEQDQRGRVVLLVDLRDSRWDHGGFEAALGAATGVATGALDLHLQLRLVTSAGTDTGLGSGPGHRGRVLDELALAGPHRGGSLTGGAAGGHRRPLAAGLGPGDCTIVVSSDRIDAADQRQIRELSHHAPVTLLLIELDHRARPRVRRPAPGRRGLWVLPIGVAATAAPPR
jgi:uncharacterized protein (DUF58 family)